MSKNPRDPWFSRGGSDKDRLPSPSLRRLKRERDGVQTARKADEPRPAASPAASQAASQAELKPDAKPDSKLERTEPAGPTADTLSARSVEKLATRSAQGSHADFAELVRRYHDRVYNFLLKRTRNPDEAADLTQEAFVRAWQRIDRYDPRWQFSTWIFTIAVRLSVSRQRREKRKVCADDLDQTRSSKLPGAEELLDRRETVELGRTLWELAEDVLSEDQYLAVWLRYAEGMAMADIAKVIGKSQVGVRVSLFRARAALAQAAKNIPALAGELNGHGTAASRGMMDDTGAACAEAAPMTTVGVRVTSMGATPMNNKQGGGR